MASTCIDNTPITQIKYYNHTDDCKVDDKMDPCSKCTISIIILGTYCMNCNEPKHNTDYRADTMARQAMGWIPRPNN